jgi:hypothetical protein
VFTTWVLVLLIKEGTLKLPPKLCICVLTQPSSVFTIKGYLVVVGGRWRWCHTSLLPTPQHSISLSLYTHNKTPTRWHLFAHNFHWWSLDEVYSDRYLLPRCHPTWGVHKIDNTTPYIQGYRTSNFLDLNQGERRVPPRCTTLTNYSLRSLLYDFLLGFLSLKNKCI